MYPGQVNIEKMQNKRIKELIDKIVAGNATAGDIEEISNTIQDEQDSIAEDIHSMLTHPDDQQFFDDKKKWDLISDKILTTDRNTEETGVGSKIIRLVKKMPGAAAVLIVLASAIYLSVLNNKTSGITKITETLVSKDVAAQKHVDVVFNLSNVKILEASHGVHLKLEQNKIFVMP
jgi:hypothetical protein